MKMYTKNEIVNWIKEYAKASNLRGVVIGVSGGKDSAVVAALCCEALGKHNVFGVLMPNNVQSDISDSKEVVEFLGIKNVTINIGSAYKELVSTINDSMSGSIFEPDSKIKKLDKESNQAHDFLNDKTKTNIPPRLRMTTLYAVAQELGYRVAGTGNRSEAYVGWFTKWGDGAHDFNPIAHLTTEQVINVGIELGLPEHLVKKTPADGLTGKSDEDNLGFTYKKLNDFILKSELKSTYVGDNDEESIDDVVVKLKIEKLHKISAHKREPVPNMINTTFK